MVFNHPHCEISSRSLTRITAILNYTAYLCHLTDGGVSVFPISTACIQEDIRGLADLLPGQASFAFARLVQLLNPLIDLAQCLVAEAIYHFLGGMPDFVIVDHGRNRVS